MSVSEFYFIIFTLPSEKTLGPRVYILAKLLSSSRFISAQKLFPLANVGDYVPEVLNRSRERYGTVPGSPKLDEVQENLGMQTAQESCPQRALGLKPVTSDNTAAKRTGRSLWHNHVLCVDIKTHQNLTLK